MKTTKKVITLILALALIFALAAPAFAQVSGNLPSYPNGASSYVQSTLSDYYVNGQITVHLHVTTFQYSGGGSIDRVFNVTVGTANQTNQLITVKDVLMQADQDNNDIAFDIQSQYETQTNTWAYYLTGVQDTEFSPYVDYDDAILYKGGNAYGCGYMFRINGMIPFYTPTGSNDPIGCLISDAYVTADDCIDLYYANINTQTLATKVRYVRKIDNSTFQLLEAECYKPTNQQEWVLTNWAPVTSNAKVAVYIDGVSRKVSLNSSGQFTYTGLSSGTHTFKFKLETDTYTTQINGGYTYNVPKIVGMFSSYVFS